MKLSILIAAYNVENFIEKCILSCYDKQYVQDYEIIVVNDGSTDETLNIIENISPKILNLKIISKKNQGLGAARNTGIENASGQYLWMIDGDDYLEDGILFHILSEIGLNKDCYAINYNVVKENGEILYTKYPSKYITEELTGSLYYSQYFQNSYTWQYIFKKSIFTTNEIKFKERINMQDSEILPKLMFYTNRVSYIDKVGYNYVQQENSFTNTLDSSKRYKYFESIIAVKDSLEEFANQIETKDDILYKAILTKIQTLNEIVFNHLVFFNYTPDNFKKIISLLRTNQLYPLKYSPKGKLLLIKYAFNISPSFTRKLINILRNKSIDANNHTTI